MPISLGTTTITALFLGTTSITSAYLGATQVFGGSFTPLSLFSGGAQGIWLDPSDLSTMFSDRAGTIQVTTPGTVVGKRLDKSGRGNHATAPTDAARPIYGVEPKGGRRNLLTWSEDFGNAVWVGANWVRSANAQTAPDGTLTADKLSPTTGTSTQGIGQAFACTSGVTYTASVYAKAGEIAQFNFRPTGSNTLRAFFNLSAGSSANTGSITSSITPVGDSGWYRCSVTWTEAVGGSFSCGFSRADGETADGIIGFFVWGAQLERDA